MSAIATLLPRLRQQRPLIHCVTNPVSQLFVADALNAVAARPIMATGADEISAIAGAAGAVLVNMGVPQPQSLDLYRAAAQAAEASATTKGWVLDPVGVGGTAFRDGIAAALLKAKPSIIRGNAGEIMALAGQAQVVEGVDSLVTPEEAAGAAKLLAEKLGCVIAMTGETDYVIAADRVSRLTGGDPMMAAVTGTGCVAGALCTAFLAVADDPFDAAVAGLHLMSGAGDHAARAAKGPGSFRTAFLDALYGAATQ